ncbi:unannotated protein [freshwater metagenome]|uniref:Unannotated protein n=1 Tax=freshwater metagenome TaxID=449393 RepID=A0A6J7SQS4_9ZZZZ|nr:MOSC domain-containing protein [Actinomycetota bacterium]MTB04121.1 MOSC domain-containing protein [Actinomycetota bacterium]MTB09004.1 MOSC domain-containing protein [Actinomycetota bacterium]
MKVTRLSTTAVKGFQINHPHSIEVTERGAVGDREFFFVDHENALVSITKEGALVSLFAQYDANNATLSIIENGQVVAQGSVNEGQQQAGNFFDAWDVEGNLIAGPWDELISERLGKKVRLIKTSKGRNGSDVEPLSLVSSASIKALEDSAQMGVIDARRFRMLIQVDGTGAHEEDTWADQEFSVGSAIIRAGGPVKRCAATTRNPDSGSVDLKTLKLIGDYRGRQESRFGLGFNFGIYATCLQPGLITVGDELIKLAT